MRLDMALAAKSPTKQEFTIPSLCDASAEYAALVARKDGLFAQKATTEKEIAGLVKALRTVPHAERHSKAVAELVGDHLPNSESPRPSRERLNELQQHLNAIDKAIRVIDSRIGTERSKASAVVCDLVQDEHRRRVRDVCFKLIELREAMLSYSQMVDELNDQDVQWSRLSPSQLLVLGEPRSPQSPAAHYLRTMVKTGFLDPSEVPKAIR
jgi:hypothetical protein